MSTEPDPFNAAPLALEQVVARALEEERRLNTPEGWEQVEDFPPGRGYKRLRHRSSGLIKTTAIGSCAFPALTMRESMRLWKWLVARGKW